MVGPSGLPVQPCKNFVIAAEADMLSRSGTEGFRGMDAVHSLTGADKATHVGAAMQAEEIMTFAWFRKTERYA